MYHLKWYSTNYAATQRLENMLFVPHVTAYIPLPITYPFLPLKTTTTDSSDVHPERFC